MRSSLQMEMGLLNTVTWPTSRPPMMYMSSISWLLSLLALAACGSELEELASDWTGLTRLSLWISAETGLGLRPPLWWKEEEVFVVDLSAVVVGLANSSDIASMAPLT